MTRQRTSGLAVMAGTALFSLFLATSVSAADVAKMIEDCDSCHGNQKYRLSVEFPRLFSTTP